MFELKFNEGIQYAQVVLNGVKAINADNRLDGVYFSVQTFYNCREQGYMLFCYRANIVAHVWVCAQRNDDDCVMVVTSTFDESKPNHPVVFNNKWSETDYQNARYFDKADIADAIKYVDNFIHSVYD